MGGTNLFGWQVLANVGADVILDFRTCLILDGVQSERGAVSGLNKLSKHDLVGNGMLSTAGSMKNGQIWTQF